MNLYTYYSLVNMGGFLLALIYFLLFAIFSAFLVPILCLCEVFTQILKIYLCIKHKQWIKLVENADCTVLVFKETTMSVLNGYFTFRGSVDMEEMKNAVKSKWTEVKDKENQYKHLRLRELVVESCGYFYWLIDKNFSIDNHIQIYDCKPPKNQNQLDDLCSQISSQPLPKNQSPWLLLLFPLDDSFGDEPRYVIFYRLHHCLGDGYNLNRMLNYCFLDEKYLNFLKPKTKKKIPITTLLTTLFYYPKFMIDCCLTKDTNILHGPPQTGKRFLRHVSLYSLPRVKETAKRTGTTINDVMVSCTAGALKRYFSKKAAIPLGDVHCLIPVALQSASEEASFKNNSSGSTIILSLGEDTVLGRLKSTQQAMSIFKNLPFYVFNNFSTNMFFNRLPHHISRNLFVLQGVTCLLSNVPTQQSRCFGINGNELLSCRPLPLHNSKIGLGLTIASFIQNIQLTVSADEAIMKNQDVDTIVKSFIEEFEELDECVTSQNYY